MLGCTVGNREERPFAAATIPAPPLASRQALGGLVRRARVELEVLMANPVRLRTWQEGPTLARGARA